MNLKYQERFKILEHDTKLLRKVCERLIQDNDLLQLNISALEKKHKKILDLYALRMNNQQRQINILVEINNNEVRRNYQIRGARLQ